MEEYTRVIKNHQLSWERKLTTVKFLKAEGLTLDTPALKLLMVDNLRFQLSW